MGPEPPTCTCHWDYVLVEMRWLATDFAGERLWKLAAARQAAKLAAAQACKAKKGLKPVNSRKLADKPPVPRDAAAAAAVADAVELGGAANKGELQKAAVTAAAKAAAGQPLAPMTPPKVEDGLTAFFYSCVHGWAAQYAAVTQTAEAVRLQQGQEAVKEWDYEHNLLMREVAAAQRELDEGQQAAVKAVQQVCVCVCV